MAHVEDREQHPDGADPGDGVKAIAAHLDRLSRRHVAVAAPDSREGVERGVVGVGQGVQVALGGGDAGVPEPLFDDLQVGAASEQPRGVRVP